MYDLSGSDSSSGKSKEWIEIYNNGANDVAIDASKWRIYDGSGNRTINGEVDFSISAGGYVIFAGDKDTFLLDHSGFSGIVYDTGITSLNNTDDTLKIIDQDGNAIDTVTYASSQGGAGDGNSLQKISDTWVGATPTPGMANEAVENPPPPPTPLPVTPPSGGGGGSSGSSSSSSTETKTKVIQEQKIKTQIVSKTLGIVGIPVSLDGKVYGTQGEKLYSGKVFWNFGDGDSKEIQLNYNEPFAHTYFYPGEYTVSFFYYSNYYSDIVDASSQVTIKIIPASVTISRVGDEKDFFVELSNDTDYGIDISNWLLTGNEKSFTIPKNTVLASKKKMIISPRITNFSILDKSSLKLTTPQNEIVFDYAVAEEKPSYSRKISKSNTNTTNTTNTVVTTKLSDILPANVVASELAKDENKNNTNSFPIFPIISVIFIGASACGVYFVRRRKTTVNEGDDFEILDE